MPEFLIEQDLSLRQVTVRLPPEHIPALLAHLGEFALRDKVSDFTFILGDVDTTNGNYIEQSPNLEDFSHYNPELTIVGRDIMTGRFVIMTKHTHLVKVAQLIKDEGGYADRRLPNRLFKKRGKDPGPGLDPYIYLDHAGNVVGLRTELLPQLAWALRRGGELDFLRLTDKTITHLDEYCKRAIVSPIDSGPDDTTAQILGQDPSDRLL